MWWRLQPYEEPCCPWRSGKSMVKVDPCMSEAASVHELLTLPLTLPLPLTLTLTLGA